MYNLLLCATVFSLFYCSFITCEGLTKIPSSLQPPIAGPFPPTFFCSTQSGILPTDGTQKILGGESCSSTPQGVIPSTKKMVSSLIVSPTSGTTVEISKGIDILVHTRNLATGFFDGKMVARNVVHVTMWFGNEVMTRRTCLGDTLNLLFTKRYI